MLPTALLSVESTPIGARPRYLGTKDEAWVRALAGEYVDLVGRSRALLDEAWADRMEPFARRAGASKRAAAGVRLVLDKLHGFEVRAACPPEKVRAAVFPLAAKGGERVAVLEKAAAALKVSADAVEASLFADRAEERVLGARKAQVFPRDVIDTYNLRLVQGLMLRAEKLEVELPEAVRPVVRYAKLLGLIVAFSETASGGMRLEMSGPLSLFRYTLKYGRALAGFFPCVVGTPGYAVVARCQLEGNMVDVRVRAGDPLPRTHALPREYDSAIERALARDVRRLGTEWTLVREASMLRSGSHVVFPDFTLVRGEDRVLVEIVGYYTAEYLERKTRALAEAGAGPMIVCVDDALACEDGQFGSGAVIRFHKRVDAARLVRRAEELAAMGAHR